MQLTVTSQPWQRNILVYSQYTSEIDTQWLVAAKGVNGCMLGCLQYAPCLYSEVCSYIPIVLLSDKDMKMDLLL